MYDDTCKFLAEHFSADFASWLLGETVTLTEIQPSKLSLDPIRADAMILLQSEDSILHIEFQTIPKENIPFRMLDYRVRGNRRYKGKLMRQVVIYLKPTTSELPIKPVTIWNALITNLTWCGCGSNLLLSFCNIQDSCPSRHSARAKVQLRCCGKSLNLSSRSRNQ
jgi:hypothetical protein